MSQGYAKLKIFYLFLVILFTLGVLTFLLDNWGVIRLENYLPFLETKPPVVPVGEDSPSELEREWLRKEIARLQEEEARLAEEKVELGLLRAEVLKKEEDLRQREKGLEEERRRIEEEKVENANRADMIRDMAARLNAMPPDDAVGIVAGWSNSDLVEVFLQMESDAGDQGIASIVPFLITKLPRERAGLITTLMMDAEVQKLPVP